MATASRTVLALCAHPDDADFYGGGTLILLARQGWRVHVATLTSGDCGSAEESANVIAIRRRAEAQAAVARLGGVYHCLGGQDLQVFNDNATRAAVTALMRAVNPDCVLTHYPVDYMPDHEVASAAARAAVFCAPVPNYVVGPAAALPPTAHLVPLYYLCPTGRTDYLGHPVSPDILIDITPVIEEKAAMLGCHASQREWLKKQHGMDQYIEEMKAWDAELGRQAGVPFAEGFFMHRGHPYPQTPLIQDAVGDHCLAAGTATC